MRELQVGALAAGSGCSLIAKVSEVTPDFIVAENAGNQLMAARWRRRRVLPDEQQRLNEHLLSYCAAGNASCTVDADGERLFARQRPHSLSLLRAGQSIRVDLDAPEDVVHLHVYLAPEKVEAFAREVLGRDEAPRLGNRMGIQDPWLEHFFRLLIAEYEIYRHDLRLGDSLFLDQTEAVLIGYLVTRYTENAPRSERGRRPTRVSALRPTLLRRVEEHVEAQLGTPIRLAALAQLASMSVGHFARAFHIATGMTPHQYVLSRRLDRARELLRAREMSIAEIASTCGFSGAAHFSTAFRHAHAVTPSHYRRVQ